MSIASMIPWKQVMLKVYNRLAINKEGKHRDGPIIILLSLVVALAAYHPLIERIDPSMNVYRRLLRVGTGASYSFYSGTTGGEYKRIGAELVEQELESNIHLRHVPRKSKKELGEGEQTRANNLKMALNKQNAIAVVQQDELKRAEIEDEIRVVAPLYGEKMHVLYRLQDLGGVPSSALPVLSRNPTPLVRSFVESARIHMASGFSRKGSYVSDHVLLMCGLDAEQLRYGLSIGDAIDRLVNSSLNDGDKEGLDLAFILAGSPLSDLTPYLKKNVSLGLMSVDPAIVTEMNQTFGTRYPPTTFNGKYDSRFDRVRSLETHAMLVASLDVPDHVILDVSERLRDLRNEDYPINEYSDHDRVKRELPDAIRARAEAWGGFAGFVFLLCPFLVAFITWGVSSVKLHNYFEQMTAAYKNRLPSNTDVTLPESGLSVPAPPDDHEAVLKELVAGMSEILAIIGRVREDYNTGGIIVSHQQHLVDSVYQMKQIFMRNIGQSLNAALEAGTEISKDQIVRYYGAGYIDLPAYLHLLARIEPNREMTPTTPPRSEDSREFRAQGKSRNF